jgi:hypothetical protein
MITEWGLFYSILQFWLFSNHTVNTVSEVRGAVVVPLGPLWNDTEPRVRSKNKFVHTLGHFVRSLQTYKVKAIPIKSHFQIPPKCFQGWGLWLSGRMLG